MSWADCYSLKKRNLEVIPAWEKPDTTPRNQTKLENADRRIYIIMEYICCCCCYVASVVSDSVRTHRRQPTRLRHPWDSPGKNTRVGCHFLPKAWKWKVKVKSLSRVRLLATPWTAAYQAPPSMGFSRQGYWSGLPLPSPIVPLTRGISRLLSCWEYRTERI